jgi:hypothetical protein
MGNEVNPFTGDNISFFAILAIPYPRGFPLDGRRDPFFWGRNGPDGDSYFLNIMLFQLVIIDIFFLDKVIGF